MVPERVRSHPDSIRDYEAILAKLALDHADLELRDFEPPVGTTRLREFIDTRWGRAAPRTRKKVRSVLMSFFKWAEGEFKLHGNPVAAIRSPRLRDVERDLFGGTRWPPSSRRSRSFATGWRSSSCS